MKNQIHQLLNYGKHPEYGRYKNLITSPITSFWDAEGLPWMKKRRTQRKTWIFYGIYTEHLFAGLAIVDAGMVANAFAYFFVPSENLFIEDKLTLPMGFGTKFDPTLTDEWKLGKYGIQTTNQLMSLNYKGSKFKLEITAQLEDNGVSIVAPSENDRPFNFTYKDLPIQSQVKVSYNDKTYQQEGRIGAIDFTKGYPPRKTTWNWSSLIGKTQSGREIAVNLVDHFNNNLENILWLDKERIVISDVIFKHGENLRKDDWQIRSKDGILELTLYPYGMRAENINVAVMKSSFTQPFGKYEGIVTINGNSENFTAWGVAEEHFALW
ncbi:MAG: DUF2804 domain-containing protein [Chitinophagales bacterium]|nr:DUF2804 domain-containing protein [Chitinophagales bacterium]